MLYLSLMLSLLLLLPLSLMLSRVEVLFRREQKVPRGGKIQPVR